MTQSQIPFDLGYKTAFSRDDFFVSESNREAVAWIDKWPDWPAPALIIYGAKGAGKTHLTEAWRQKAGAAEIAVIDDIDTLIGNRAEEEKVFHLYNVLKEKGGHMLVTASTAPAVWNFTLPDLKSRLMAAPAVSLGMPDDNLIAAVLTKLFSDRQIFVSQEVVQFIVPRIERSLDAVGNIVDLIDRKALTEKRAVTVPLVRDILSSQG